MWIRITGQAAQYIPLTVLGYLKGKKRGNGALSRLCRTSVYPPAHMWKGKRRGISRACRKQSLGRKHIGRVGERGGRVFGVTISRMQDDILHLNIEVDIVVNGVRG